VLLLTVACPGITRAAELTLVAPNGDTAYTVTDDNPAVNTWMVGPALNAEAP